MTTSAKTCPVCDSTDVSTTREFRTIAVQLGPAIEYSAVVDRCVNCGEVGDFDGANEVAIKESLAKSEVLAVQQMLDGLVSRGVSFASLERGLRLPQRTMSRWKDGKVSAGAATLLRMISTFPWLIDVADAGFSQQAAASAVIREAATLIGQAMATLTPNLERGRFNITLQFEPVYRFEPSFEILSSGAR